MAAQLIPVGVYALDQFDLPERQPGVGLAATLAAKPPVLRKGAVTSTVPVANTEAGMILGGPLTLSGDAQPEGARVTVDALPGLAGYLPVRIGGRLVALARSGAGSLAERPDLLSAFVAGTLIDTPEGPRPVEDLQAGDRVTTLDNGSRPLVWVGRRRVLPVELLAFPGLRPVMLPTDRLRNDRPLLVSPRQRVLIDDWRAEVYFAEDRVLVAAEALTDSPDPRPPLGAEGVDYVILLCDRHEILVANGALTESFHPGEAGLAALTPAERADLALVIAEADLIRRRSACPVIRNAEARAMKL